MDAKPVSQDVCRFNMNDADLVSDRIHFAPLTVPLQRRFQTLMVLLHTLSIALLLTVFFFLCTVPLLWPILLPYLIYVLFSKAAISGELSHRSISFGHFPSGHSSLNISLPAFIAPLLSRPRANTSLGIIPMESYHMARSPLLQLKL